jgi:SAM-dependent methyltransferase
LADGTAHLLFTGRVAIREESERRETYHARYRTEILEANLAIEREAVGSDYGNNGYTTVAQADLLETALELGAGDLLLDIGAGAGWPGLYLAKKSGCRVVVSDLTVPGMRQAIRRAAADDLAGRAAAVVASARQLPFRPDSFDAMVHADVLC